MAGGKPVNNFGRSDGPRGWEARQTSASLPPSPFSKEATHLFMRRDAGTGFLQVCNHPCSLFPPSHVSATWRAEGKKGGKGTKTDDGDSSDRILGRYDAPSLKDACGDNVLHFLLEHCRVPISLREGRSL